MKNPLLICNQCVSPAPQGHRPVCWAFSFAENITDGYMNGHRQECLRGQVGICGKTKHYRLNYIQSL